MIYPILGSFLILLGGLHLLDPISEFETRIVQRLQMVFNQKAFLFIFREIWFFGRTSFTMIMIFFLVCIDWKVGLTALVIFLLIVGIEQLIKSNFNRSRPYRTNDKIEMLQPLEPFDPSYPSGDALRVWYLALTIPVFAGNSPVLIAAAIALALAVTLGRMVMGVHYLTDTLTGTGLGMLGAGTTIWLWHFLNIL
jgi:membrane-associated phospholipid phosphatase